MELPNNQLFVNCFNKEYLFKMIAKMLMLKITATRPLLIWYLFANYSKVPIIKSFSVVSGH